mgnify:FL=1
MVAINKNGTIQTFNRLPNKWVDEKGVHINFRLCENKEDYGFYDVVRPDYDSITQRLSPIFWDADKKIFTYTVSNIDFDATYTIEVEDEEGNKTEETKPVYDKEKLKADIISTIKSKANNLLAPTDWYSSRKSELGTAIPDSVLADRKKIRDKVDALETEVNALDNVEAILKYTYTFTEQAEQPK